MMALIAIRRIDELVPCMYNGHIAGAASVRVHERLYSRTVGLNVVALIHQPRY